MASKAFAVVALFISLNLLFVSPRVTATTTSTSCGCATPPPNPTSPPPPPSVPRTPPSPIPTPTPPPPSVPTPTTPPSTGTCPIDVLRLRVCANLLGGLLGAVIGNPSNTQCCTLLQGLADLDAAVCLCTALRANVLGINLNVPISLSLILNDCGNNASGFRCP